MRRFLTIAARDVRSDAGTTSTEYAVLLALLIVAGAATLSWLVGSGVNAIFSNVHTVLETP